MQDYVYLKSTINPGYIQKVSRQDYLSNPQKYPYMMPLSGEATRAEDIYRQKVQQNEWKFRGQAFASGLTAGLYENLGLSSEEKELLGKYKQRSSMGGVFNFLGVATALTPVGRGVRLAAGAARAAGLGATGAAVAGVGAEAAGLTAYTGTQRIGELVGQGKNVTIKHGAQILQEEFTKNALIGAGFGVSLKGLGLAYRGAGKGVTAVRNAVGFKRQGQRQLDVGHASKAWGVQLQKVKTGAEAQLGQQVLTESNRIIGRLVKGGVDPKSLTAHDLLRGVDQSLKSSGKSFARLLKKIDATLPRVITAKGISQIFRKIDDVLKGINEHALLKGPLTKDAKTLRRAINENLFVTVKTSAGHTVRRLKPGLMNNLKVTRQLVDHMRQKAKSEVQKGAFKNIYRGLREVEELALGIAGKGLTSVDKALRTRYSTLSTMKEGIKSRIATASKEALSPSTFRDVARAALLGAAGGGLIGGMGGVSMFLGGTLIGGAVGAVARKTHHRPWHMSIYPDIAEKANRFLSGGKFLPSVFSQNIHQNAVRRSALIQRLSNGVQTLGPDAKSIAKLTMFKHINEKLSLDEKRDVFVSLRDSAKEIMGDPQKINQVSMGAAEVVSQAGGSSFSPMIQMGVIDGMRKFIEAFPRDRALPRADDLMEKENLWTKRELDMIGRRMQVFFEPDAVMEDIIEGKTLVTLDQVQYMKFFHPEFFNAVRNSIMMGLNNGTLKLSRKDRVRLSYLFKLPIDIATHPKMLNITEEVGNLNLARQAGQKEQVRKNLNIERKADSLKTAAERSLLQEDQS